MFKLLLYCPPHSSYTLRTVRAWSMDLQSIRYKVWIYKDCIWYLNLQAFGNAVIWSFYLGIFSKFLKQTVFNNAQDMFLSLPPFLLSSLPSFLPPNMSNETFFYVQTKIGSHLQKFSSKVLLLPAGSCKLPQCALNTGPHGIWHLNKANKKILHNWM